MPTRSIAFAAALVAFVAHWSTPTSSATTEPAANSGYFDVEMAADVLTRPDYTTTRDVRTRRWTKPALAVRIDLPHTRDEDVWEVLDDLTSLTDLDFHLTGAPDEADLTVQDRPQGNGGRVLLTTKTNGEILRAQVTIGCCRHRVLAEELAQAMGAMGDRADARSVFSNDQEATTLSDFDRWVLTTLYRLPPGTPRPAVIEALRATSPAADQRLTPSGPAGTIHPMTDNTCPDCGIDPTVCPECGEARHAPDTDCVLYQRVLDLVAWLEATDGDTPLADWLGS